MFFVMLNVADVFDSVVDTDVERGRRAAAASKSNPTPLVHVTFEQHATAL
jgi:hypothetical protein